MVLEARLPFDHSPVGTRGGAVPAEVLFEHSDEAALSPSSPLNHNPLTVYPISDEAARKDQKWS